MHLAQGRCTVAFGVVKIRFFRFSNRGAPIRSFDRTGGTPPMWTYFRSKICDGGADGANVGKLAFTIFNHS